MLNYLEHIYLLKGMIGIVFAGIVCQFLLWMSYKRLQRDSYDMQGKRKKWTATLRKKFENYYQLDANLNNVSCVVDKYLLENTICGVPAIIVEKVPKLCAILCVFLGCFEMIKKYMEGEMIEVLLPSFLCSVLSAIIISAFIQLLSILPNKQKARTNMIYFLENILPNRCYKEKKKKQEVKQQEEENQKKMKKEDENEEKNVKQVEREWKEIAAAKEYDLTPEEIKTMKELFREF